MNAHTTLYGLYIVDIIFTKEIITGYFVTRHFVTRQFVTRTFPHKTFRHTDISSHEHFVIRQFVTLTFRHRRTVRWHKIYIKKRKFKIFCLTTSY